MFVIKKNNFLQKTSKMIWQPSVTVRLALFLHLLREKIQVFITFQHYHVTQRLVGHNSVGNKTRSSHKTKKYRCLLHFKIKAIRPRPRPRPVWDRYRHKTAVSDPKTDTNTRKPCYRRENRAMPLKIWMPIESYNRIVQFPSHSTAFLFVFVLVCILVQWTICQKVTIIKY